MWQDILTSILTSGAITGVFLSLINKAIKHKFDIKFEEYKQKLKSESDKELMQLTKDLDSKATERNIKLSEVFKTQADVITDIYRNLLELKDKTRYFVAVSGVSEDGQEQQTLQSWVDSRNKTIKHFEENEIYIRPATSEIIQILFFKLKATVLAQKSINTQQSSYATTNRDQRIVILNKIHQEIATYEKEIEELLKALKKDFHELLGFPFSGKNK
jgi:hypothetical protein